jgi:cellulose synthase operon protein C
MAMGLLANARQRIERAIRQAPESLPLQAELARAAMAQGDRATVQRLVETATVHWKQKRIEQTVPANLMAMATIAQLGQAWTWGNELFREAVERAPLAAEPNVGWGQLFMEKHTASEAAKSFKQALKTDPKHPEAWVGIARTALEMGYDRATAESAVSAALAENPRHSGALAVRGEMSLDGEDYFQAESMISALRNINPHDADADWLNAAIAKLRGDETTYIKIRNARLAVRHADGDFFANVAEALVRQRRYRDARAVAEECVLQAPGAVRCRTSLGTTLIRLGDERNGLTILREAFAADPYNTRIYNQLQLFDKSIKNNYRVVQTEHLQFRVRPMDTVMLERIVAPQLEAVFLNYVKRYNYTPPYKVMFELYGDRDQFAVRTVGLPGLDVSAVCFGPVITAISPTVGSSNWALVLSHELAHVFSLGISRERVPRWLTEGLAEWQIGQLKPQWQRHDDLALWGALKRRTLPPFGEMSKAFFLASSNEDAVSAYQYASHAVGFLVQRFGFPAVRKMLASFGEGMTERSALETISGGGMRGLQSEFQQYLDARFAELSAQFLPDHTERRTFAEAIVNTQKPDTTAEDFARAALAAVDANFLQKATALWNEGDALWKKAQKVPPSRDRSAALLGFAWARIAEAEGRAPEDILRNLHSLIERGFDGYDVRSRIALTALRAGQLEVARINLAKAMTLAPNEVEGWSLLAEVLDQQNKGRDALAARIRAFVLDAQNGEQGLQLLRKSESIEATDLALAVAPRVFEVAPANGVAHAIYGRALQATAQISEAVVEYEHALALGVPNSSELKSSIAQLRRSDAPASKEGPPHQIPQEAAPVPSRGPAPAIPSRL